MRFTITLNNNKYCAGLVEKGNYATLAFTGPISAVSTLSEINIDGTLWNILSVTPSIYVSGMICINLEKN